MRYKLLLIILVLSAHSAWSQGLKVLIKEKKQGKRLELVAENKTQDTLNVFLMVNAKGYRRSASKPVIKNVPPLSEVPMITLIELSGVESMYTFDLVVNEKDSPMSFSYDSPERDIERVMIGKIVIFTAEACTKCTILSEKLDDKRIQHRIIDIHQDAMLYGQFMSFIERKLTSETKIKFPVIWDRDDVIFGYDELDDIVLRLSE
ncbi:glutaredoxin [Aureitalea sp. L0-47]|uniref:glutaredoxin family protein n=1 Tax=Aureitalea sp. L0-47 TaxID=2816962 RepID=UPI0022386A80|nr:glutaredoxin [Aureitalea sp. L0-47]MCW5520281.1 glutaredoxin [Aureitalea sp. L0-47]